MRKLVVLSFISLDGVRRLQEGLMRTPAADSAGAAGLSPTLTTTSARWATKQLDRPFALLLGKRTCNIFAAYWPYADAKKNPFAGPFNSAKKNVASRTRDKAWLEQFGARPRGMSRRRSRS